MTSLMTATTAGLVVAVLGLAAVGCSTATDTTTAGETSTAATTATVADAGDRITLNEYIDANEIDEYPIMPGDPGTPEVDFPLPPDWRVAGDEKPDWAYGAIIYDKAVDPGEPPYMYAIGVKLTGDVDPAKILEYAPGQLNDFPEFEALGEPKANSLGGFEAVDYVGTYVRDGEPWAVGQRTVVIPGKDALFVLQINAEAPQAQKDVVVDAIKIISEQTEITVPG